MLKHPRCCPQGLHQVYLIGPTVHVAANNSVILGCRSRLRGYKSLAKAKLLPATSETFLLSGWGTLKRERVLFLRSGYSAVSS